VLFHLVALRAEKMAAGLVFAKHSGTPGVRLTARGGQILSVKPASACVPLIAT
jgi:hypothetical protein